MISVDLATTLKTAGLVWRPAPGDRFTLVQESFAGEIFTLSEMVVQAQEFPTGTVLAFNGTTEWALDSAEAADALWLPREDQLREMLRTSFRSLERVAEGYRVTAVLPGGAGSSSVPAGEVFWGPEPAEAYGRALLALIRRATT